MAEPDGRRDGLSGALLPVGLIEIRTVGVPGDPRFGVADCVGTGVDGTAFPPGPEQESESGLAFPVRYSPLRRPDHSEAEPGNSSIASFPGHPLL